MGNARDDTARIEKAENVYRNVKRGTGILALVVGVCYGFAVGVAMSDGDSAGFELPVEIATAWVGVWIILALLSSGAWLLEKGNYVSAHQILAPTIRAAVRVEMEAQTPVVARGVAQVVTRETAAQMGTIAGKVGDRTVAAMRDVLTGEIDNTIRDALKREHRFGMIRQAQGANGAVARIPHLREVPPGD